MNTWNIVGIVAAITAFLSFAKPIFNNLKALCRYMIGEMNLEPELAAAVYGYCHKNMKLMPFRTKSYAGCSGFIKSKQREETLAFDVLANERILFRKGWRFATVKPGRYYFHPTLNTLERGVTVCLPRIMWNADKFLKKALEEFNEMSASQSKAKTQAVKRFAIYKIYGKNKKALTLSNSKVEESVKIKLAGSGREITEAKLGKSICINRDLSDIEVDSGPSASPFEEFPYPEEVKNHVQSERFWLKSKEWYMSKGIHWRRGWLVHGKPGTGKTLLLKSLAQDLDIPIYVFDLASMSNEELNSEWISAVNMSPCMIIIEDIDNIFDGRKNISSPQAELTFDCLLNCISGMNQSNGVSLGITTNDLSKIDSALGLPNKDGISSRPGRIDRVIELGNMSKNCRKILAAKILGMDDPSLHDIISQGEGMTAAQFSELCKGLALQRYWSEPFKLSTKIEEHQNIKLSTTA
jgi:hypothetical protein